MLYQRKNLADNSDVGEPGPLPAELVGLADASLADLSAALNPCPEAYAGQGFVAVSGRPVSSLAFMQRFTLAERIAIRAAAATDPVIADYLDLLQKAKSVRLDAADTEAGIVYLVTQELIDAERAAEILS